MCAAATIVMITTSLAVLRQQIARTAYLIPTRPGGGFNRGFVHVAISFVNRFLAVLRLQIAFSAIPTICRGLVHVAMGLVTR